MLGTLRIAESQPTGSIGKGYAGLQASDPHTTSETSAIAEGHGRPKNWQGGGGGSRVDV